MTPTITYTEELLARCLKGDQRAQMEIYNKYYKAMYNTALRIVNDTAEAEDVMQRADAETLAEFPPLSSLPNHPPCYLVFVSH